MTVFWGDVNARARGFAGRLLSDPALATLAAAPDVAAVARQLAEWRIESGGGAAVSLAVPAELELAVRRTEAEPLRLLTRWLGDRVDLVRVIFEDEERRSVRALLRGAAAGAAAAVRVAGLLATPALSERLLQELARQTTPRDVAALLTAWRHPFGGPVLRAAAAAEPDWFAMELALDRRFAERAVAGARRGGRMLRRYVADVIDVDNVRIALALAAAGTRGSIPRGSALPLAECWLRGGRRVSAERFAAAAAAPDVGAAALLLAPVFDPARGALIRRDAHAPGALARALLAARIAGLHDEARRDPLGPAPLLWYVLRLRAQAMTLRAAIWGAALGAPAALRHRREVA